MFLSSTCLKNLMFIIRKTVLYMQLYVVCFSRIYASSLASWRMCSCTSSNLLELWAGHLDCRPQCPTVQVAMHESLKMTWSNQALKSGKTATVLHLNSFFIASNHPVHSLFDCHCSLLIPTNVLKHTDARFIESTTLGQLQNPHGPLLQLRLRFISFFNGALL